MGKGFAIENTKGRELVILVNGSGISAVNLLIEPELAAGLPRPVHFSTASSLWPTVPLSLTLSVGRKRSKYSHLHQSTDGSGTEGFVQYRAKDVGLVRADVSVVLVGVRPDVRPGERVLRGCGLSG